MSKSKANTSQTLVKVKWSSEYAVGIPIIDGQHKDLFDIVNTLVTYYNNQNESDLFLSYLNILVDYTIEHFSTEEKLLQDISMEEYEKQKVEHQKFKDEIITAVTSEMENDVEYRRSLILFLREWLVQHIINSDVPAFYN